MCAQWSGVWTTTSGTAGDSQASYSQADDAKMKKIVAACWGYQGIAPNYLNELKPTATAANTVRVATGGAMVDGKCYLNDAAVDVTIPSASGAGNTRIDRIVIRATWSGTDVAITRIAGTDAASPTAPAITQISGTTYDIQVCRVLVNTAGACTVTDERDFAQPPEVGLSVLGIYADTTVATWGAIAPSSTNLALVVDGTSGVHWDGIDADHIDANAIGIDHLGTMVPGFLGRQGGSSGDWSVAGTTGYTSGINVRMQCGSIQVTATAGTTVTFPVAFGAKPLVMLTNVDEGAVEIPAAGSVTATNFVAKVYVPDSPYLGTGYLYWMAIGPEA